MTADTYSATLGYIVMGVGNDNNTWGGNANTAVFQIFEDAIANALTSSVTGGTLDLSGSPPPAAASQVRYAALIFTGVLGSNQIVQVPNLQKFWWVKNATSGSFTLKIKTPSGTASTAIPQNSGWQRVYCDGSDAIVVDPFNSIAIRMPDGSVSAPPFSNINETNSGWYRNGTQDWRLAINGLDVLQVTGAGASSASVVNVLSPNVLQIAGAQVVPPGTEMAYAGIELPNGGWLWEDGTAYSRPIANGGSVDTYANLFGAVTKTATATTNTSTTLSSVSADLRYKGLLGAYIEGTGIPTGTTITAIAATTITLSQAATASAAGVSIRILPWGQGDASTTFNVPNRLERALYGRGDMNGATDPGTLTSTWTGGLGPTALNNTFGAQTITLTSQLQLPSCTFVVSVTAASQFAFQQGSAAINFAPGGGTPVYPAAATHTIDISGGAASGGTSAPINKLSPGAITNYIIKT